MFSKVFGTQPQGEELNCVQERTNTEDPYAVAVIRRSAVVGPKDVSHLCTALETKGDHLLYYYLKSAFLS